MYPVRVTSNQKLDHDPLKGYRLTASKTNNKENGFEFKEYGVFTIEMQWLEQSHSVPHTET